MDKTDNTISSMRNKLSAYKNTAKITASVLLTLLIIRGTQGLLIENKIEKEFPGYEITDISYKPFSMFNNPEHLLLGNNSIGYSREAKDSSGTKIEGTAATNYLRTMINETK